ncbi:MAG TPA: SCP2 sterol-binding domain-containing protein [Nitrososphaerales archaeon]|nr:SCP2 sterol-binding domain-containing protein [Nitrososphaerales archaeon]
MQFWSEEFFQSAAKSLNEDPRVGTSIGGISTSILADCSDLGKAFLIRVEVGRVGVSQASAGAAAEFTFSAPYQEWVSIVRDSLNIRGEVLKSRVKFRGSMPKMLLYLGRVSRMEMEIIAKMRALSPVY